MSTASPSFAAPDFEPRTAAILESLHAGGQLKRLQTIEGPMDASIRLRGYGEVACFCSNNYLGLANHPEVVEAGIEGLRKYGAGTASVRFICGTFECHEALEERIARFTGLPASYTFTSCWNANEAVFPTLGDPGDLILSDELNHASIIDGIRLAASIKKGLHKGVYRHGDLDDSAGEARSGTGEPRGDRHDLGRHRRRLLDGGRHRRPAGDPRASATSSARCSSSTTATAPGSWARPAAARMNTGTCPRRRSTA